MLKFIKKLIRKSCAVGHSPGSLPAERDKIHRELLGPTERGTVRLEVLEIDIPDYKRGFRRGGCISYNNMQFLGAHEGDVLEVRGIMSSTPSKRAVVKCDALPSPVTNEDLIIRIQGTIRDNAGVSIGDIVEVRKIDRAPPAVQVILSFMNPQREDFPELVRKEYLSDKLAGTPLLIGSHVKIPGSGVEMKVIDLAPEDIVVVTKDTDFVVSVVHASWRDVRYITSSKTRETVFLKLESPRTPAFLAKHLKISSENVNRAIAELEESGMVLCLRDTCYLTAKGKYVIAMMQNTEEKK